MQYKLSQSDWLRIGKEAGWLKEARCWKGYKAVGMKKKRGKMVPNCVRVKTAEGTVEEVVQEPPQGDVDACKALNGEVVSLVKRLKDVSRWGGDTALSWVSDFTRMPAIRSALEEEGLSPLREIRARGFSVKGEELEYCKKSLGIFVRSMSEAGEKYSKCPKMNGIKADVEKFNTYLDGKSRVISNYQRIGRRSI